MGSVLNRDVAIQHDQHFFHEFALDRVNTASPTPG
jgi:hypothetical protein